MKQNSILHLLLILASIAFSGGNAFSQQSYINQKWEVQNGQPGQQDRVVSSLDPNGNLVYVTNHMVGANSQTFLNCIIPSGNVAWQQTCPSVGIIDDYGSDLKIDLLGNIYICGAMSNGSNYDYYMAKYTPSGTLIWEQSYNGSGNGDDIPASLELDGNGNVLITGTTTGQNTMTDISTLKLNGISGAVIWTKTHTAIKPQAAIDLVIDFNGNVFVSGTDLTSAQNANILTIKYNGSTGTQMALVAASSQGNGLDYPTAIKSNADGQIFVVGTIKGSTTNSDLVLLTYSNTLQLQWSQYVDNSGRADEGTAMELDDSGNPMITGFCTKPGNGTNLYVGVYDRSNGNVIWEIERTALDDLGASKGRDITTDGTTIFVCGEEDVNGEKHFVTLAFRSDGLPLWSRHFREANSDSRASQIKVRGTDVFVTGKSTVNGQKSIASVKYSTIIRPNVIEYVGGEPSHIENTILVRFNDAKLNMAAIDDLDKEAGLLEDFVDPVLLNDLSNKTSFNWSKLNAFKIHRRATSADSLSTTRMGDVIRLPKFWASLMIELPNQFDEQTVCDSIATLDNQIYHATRDYVAKLHAHPNDTWYLPSQYGLYPNDTYPNADINARDAWDIEVGQSNVRVGVFDEIIDWSHEDFGDGTLNGSKVVGGEDYTAGDFQYANYTSLRHGTAVAGIIGALRNNNLGVGGIAGGDMQQGNIGAELYSLGIFSGAGIITNSGGYTDFATLAEAIIEGSVQTNNGYGFGLHIQNHSWGGTAPGTGDFQEAFEIAFKNHCIVVASRGNEGATNVAEWPACDFDPMVLNVIASGTDGNRKTATNGEGNWISSYGRDGSNNTPRCDVDVMAPGTNELIGTTTSSYSPNPYVFGTCGVGDPLYTCFNGTSAAAPHISGVAALMCSHHNVVNGFPNNLVIEDVEAIMEKSATDMEAPGYDLSSGFGRLNAKAALEFVADPYCVKHFVYDNNAATSTLVQTINNVNVWGATEIGIPNGTFFSEAKKYEVQWNINETLAFGDQIIDSWDFLANRYLGNSPINNGSILSGIDNYIDENLNIGSNTVNGTAKTYIYGLKQTPNSLTTWYPINPSDLQYAYTLHILKGPTGIDELSEDIFTLFPNPAQHDITLRFKDPYKENGAIRIYDAYGRLILEKELSEVSGSSNDVTIDLAGIENGVYYCKLVNDNQYAVKSFVIASK